MMPISARSAENPFQGQIFSLMGSHFAKTVGGVSMETPSWKAVDTGVDNAYRRSQEKRKELRKLHKLGFHRPERQRIRGGNSVVSIQISKLSDAEFKLLQEKLKLMPEKKRVKITHDMQKPLTTILGNELAYALIEAKPDMKKIIELSDPIPDVEKRIAAMKKGE